MYIPNISTSHIMPFLNISKKDIYMKIYNLCDEKDYNYVSNLIEKIKQSLAGVLIGGYPVPAPYIDEFLDYKERYKYYYVNDRCKIHCLTGAAIEDIKSKQRSYAINGKIISKKIFLKTQK